VSFAEDQLLRSCSTLSYKSLKKFVTIKAASIDNSPSYLFLLHGCNVPMDYNDNSVGEAVGADRVKIQYWKFDDNVW
jgi:hypothetical protein